MVEAETEEGNKFTKALDDAREDGDDTFEVDGKTYNVRKESRKSSLRLTEDELIDMIEAGELEAGHEGGEEEEAEEVGVEDEEEIDLAELLREIEEMEEIDSLEEAKKYGGNKGDEKRDDMKKEKEGHGKGPKKKDTAEDEKETDYKKKLKEELEEAYSAIESLKAELNEINLLNAKLLYTNKIFKAKNLNENQKVYLL